VDEHHGVGEDPVEHHASSGQGTQRLLRAAAGGTLAGLVGLAYAWWAVSLRPFSGWATAVVLGTGVGAMVLGRARRQRERRRRHATVAWGWVALAAAAGVWQLAAYLQHPRDDHPTLSSLTDALLDSHPTRAVAFVVWAALAVELGRR
jgi:hypothetical protein